MGTLAEQKPVVQDDVVSEETTDETPVADEQQNQESTHVDTPEETPLKEDTEPVQTVETHKLLARGDVKQAEDGPLEIEVHPLEMQEIYSLDIVDENGKSVYSVNAHSGVFKKTLELSAGKYMYLLKTKNNEMPFTVMFSVPKAEE